MRCIRVLTALALFCGSAAALTLTNGSLTGKYFVRHIQFSTNGSNVVTDARSIVGVVSFDGGGHFSLTGQQVINTNAPVPFTASGTYSMGPGGIVTLTNPQTAAATVNARFGTDGLVGSSTELSGNTFDIFVAIPAPASTNSNAVPQGSWSAANFELTSASTAHVRDSFVSLTFDGSGNVASLNLTGHAADFNNGQTVTQSIAGSTYSVSSDGSGSILFALPSGVSGSQAMLSSLARALYVSASGNVILAATPGSHDLFLAVRNATGAAAALGQRFWTAGIRVDSGGSSDSYAGSSAVVPADGAFVNTRRLHETGASPLNVTSSLPYTFASDGTGSLGSAKAALETYSLSGASPLPANMLAASNGNPLDPTGYEIAFGIAMPAVSGTGVFINPQGIVNAAGNAPAGDAVSPGEFIAIYGSGLAASTVTAQALPFPKSLGNVSVFINGTAAAIYFVAPGQIDCIVPYEVTGQTATISVVSGNVTSANVTVPLAATSPAVFTLDGSGVGPSAITHLDGTVVNAASPATKGETVQMYVSGLGNLTTRVADGAGATGINNATTPLTIYVAGIAVPAAGVLYQGLTVDAGLYQIDFVVPSTLTVSGSLPVAILTPDSFTDEVGIAVQ